MQHRCVASFVFLLQGLVLVFFRLFLIIRLYAYYQMFSRLSSAVSSHRFIIQRYVTQAHRMHCTIQNYVALADIQDQNNEEAS